MARPIPGERAREATGATVLVCEDEADLLADMQAVLAEAGHGVVAAASAEAALARLDDIRPDIILSDISLPGADGMTFLQRVRRDRPDLNDVPFVMLTAFADKADIAAGKRAGADDYLVKPVDYDLLLATIDAQLRQVSRIASTPAGAVQNSVAAGLMQAVDRLDFGVVLLDGHGRICFANSAARRLTAGRGSTMRNWLAQTLGEAEFTQAIAAAQDNLRRGRCHHSVALTSHDLPQDSWQVIVLSNLGALPATPREPMLMGLILGSEDTRRLGLRLISDVTGLTSAEFAVAELLARGLRVREIGDELSISVTTVNFHLRNIFQKTATSRQADLMLLLRSVPLADCPDCTGQPHPPRPRD